MAVESPSVETEEVVERPSGPAAAAILAVGVGAFVLGLLTTLNEALSSVHDFLAFSGGVGPLSGKTIIAGSVYFGSWAILAYIFGRSNPSLKTVSLVTGALIVLGLVMTFPIFFRAFA